MQLDRSRPRQLAHRAVKSLQCGRCGRRSDAPACHSCAQTLAQRLRDAAKLWPDVVTTIGRQARTGVKATPRPHGTPGDPVDVAALEASQRLQAMAAGVVATIRPDQASTQAGMVGMLIWLADQCGSIRQRADGAALMRSLGAVADGVARLVDLPEAWSVRTGPCPEQDGEHHCTGQLFAVLPRNGLPATMRCDTCKTTWDTTQWARVGRRVLQRKRELERERANS